MRFDEVLRKRRMVRRFLPEPVPPAVLERVLRAGLRAPSAGNSQGLDLLVIQAPSDLDWFWSTIDPRERKRRSQDDPPVVVLPCISSGAYTERYSKSDKRSLGMGTEEAWPLPFWHLDAGMSVMTILLAAVDEGLGAWFFGIFHGEDELREGLGIPRSHRPVGAVALGYAHPDDGPIGSAISIPRRGVSDGVHRDRWGQPWDVS